MQYYKFELYIFIWAPHGNIYEIEIRVFVHFLIQSELCHNQKRTFVKNSGNSKSAQK